MRKLIIFFLLLIPITGHAATFYVDGTNGLDANNGSQGSPWKTLTKGVNTISAGDTLYVRSGTYVASGALLTTTPTSTQQIPSGSSWATATRISAFPTSTPGGCDPRGSDASTVYSNCRDTVYESVTLQPTSSGSNAIRLEGGPDQYPGTGLRYIIFEGLKALGGSFPVSFGTTGGNCGSANDSPDHIRLLSMEVSGGRASGIFVQHWGFANEFINVNVHHNGGDSKDHGIYMSGHDHKIIGGAFHHNSGYGLHLYHNAANDPCATPDGIGGGLVERVRLHENRNGVILGQYTGGWIFKNNLVYLNTNLGLNVGSSGHKVWNNTIWANVGVGLQTLGATSTSEIKNTITDSLTTPQGSAGLVLANNLTSTTTDHKFVNAGIGDFRLRTDSPALNQGVNLTSVGVTTDFAGVSRPQGSAFDIGAHELAESGGNPVVPFNFSLVSQGSKSVLQGQAVDNVITVTTSAGTAAEVTFAASGLPAGVTVGFVPTSCTPTTPCTTTATFTSHVTSPQGTFPVTITGTSGGVSRTTTFNLEVICQ